MLSLQQKQQKGYQSPRWKHPSKRKAMVLSLMTTLLTLLNPVYAVDVCGTSQDWYHGFLDTAQITYQTMDVAFTRKRAIVGATTTNLEAFDDTQLQTLDTGDIAAAVVIHYILNSKDPYNVYVVSRVTLGGAITKVDGVRQVAHSASGTSFVVLFSTDQDASKVTIATYNQSYEELYFNQVSADSGFSLSTNNFIGFDNSAYPKLAGVGTDDSGSPIFYVFGYYMSSTSLTEISQIYIDELEEGAHTMHAAFNSQNAIHMITTGPCQTFTDGLMVTLIDVSATAYQHDCSRCINMADSDFTTVYGSDPYSVSQAVGYTTEETAVFLEGGSANFLSFGLNACDSPSTAPVYRLMGGLPSDTILQLVRPTSRISRLVNMTLKSSTAYHVLLNYNPFSQNSLTHTQFSAAFTSNVLEGSYSKHLLSNHLIAGVAEDTTNYLTIMSTTDLYKFEIMTETDESAQCMAANIQTSTLMTQLTASTSPSTTSQSGININAMPYNAEEVAFWNTYDFAVNPDEYFNQNACLVYLTSLYSETTHDKAGAATQMDISGLSEGTCPGSGDGSSSAFSMADVRRNFVSLVHDETGDVVDMSLFFDNIQETGATILIVTPDSSVALGTYTLTYQAGHTSQSASQVSQSPELTVKINYVIDCQFVLPTITSDSAYGDTMTFVYGDPPVVLTFSGQSAACPSTQGVVNQDDDSPIDTDLFTYSQGFATDTLSFETSNPIYERTFDLKYVMTSTDDSSLSATFNFSVTVRMSTCTKVWEYPSSGAPYSFSTVSYVIQGSSPAQLQVDLTDVDLSNCPFDLEVVDTKDPEAEGVIDSEVLTIVQPVLTVDTLDNRMVSVAEYGSMVIRTGNTAKIGTHSLKLRTWSRRFPGENNYRSKDITLNIFPCMNAESDIEIDLGYVSYTQGDELIELATVQRQEASCLFSDLTAATDIDPEFTTIIGDDEVTVALESASITIGNHTVTIIETDVYTGFTVTSTLTVEVFMKINVLNLDFITELDDISAPQQEEIVLEEPEEEEPAEDVDTEDGPFEPVVTIGPNGEVIYPWQKTQRSQVRQKINFEDESTKKIVPLKAFAKQITAIGKLTIGFNKPIIIPPIQVESLKADNSTRRLQDTDSDGEDAAAAAIQQYYYDIGSVLELEVESSFYEGGSSEILISNYTLTRLSERELDIMINFQTPQKITQTPSEPDQITIKFVKGQMFMDQEDYTQLAADVRIFVTIPPQLSSAEIQSLCELSQNVASAIGSFSIGLIVLQFFLAMGLKYLWNIMNLLQFLIFMQMWQIKLPQTTRIVLQGLKSIALFEFIPTESFKSQLKELLGVEDESPQVIDDDSSSSCGANGSEEDSVTEKSGIERVGTPSLIDNMGAMLLIGLLICLLLLILLLLRICTKRSPCARRVYEAIKKKLFYNTLLRFVLQSTLKLQIAASTVLAYDQMMAKKESDAPVEQTESSSKMVSYGMLGIFNLCPILFLWVLCNNKPNLGKDQIKSKIGTLYVGLNPKKPRVISYSPMFLTRRSFFVLLTFTLFEQPGIQVQLMIFTTLLYVIYLGHAEFYEFSFAKSLEILNESVLILIMYNFVLLHQLVDDEQTQEQLGNVIVGLTAFLLGFNMLVIIVVSIKALSRKCFLRGLKKRAMKEYQEKLRLKRETMLTQSVTNLLTNPISAAEKSTKATGTVAMANAANKDDASSRRAQQQSSNLSNQSSGSSSSSSSEESGSSVSSMSEHPSQQHLENVDKLVDEMESKYGLTPIGTSLTLLQRQDSGFTKIKLDHPDPLTNSLRRISTMKFEGNQLVGNDFKLPSRVVDLRRQSQFVENRRPVAAAAEVTKFRRATITYGSSSLRPSLTPSPLLSLDNSGLFPGPMQQHKKSDLLMPSKTMIATTTEIDRSIRQERKQLMQQTKDIMAELNNYSLKLANASAMTTTTATKRYSLHDFQ